MTPETAYCYDCKKALTQCRCKLTPEQILAWWEEQTSPAIVKQAANDIRFLVDQIKELEAEVERLNYENITLKGARKELKAEVEKLRRALETAKKNLIKSTLTQNNK